MKRIYNTLFLLVFAVFSCFAQQLEVVSPLVHAGSVGAASVPSDNNGNPCAKIIVDLPLEGAVVEGTYVQGDISYSPGRYELFVAIPQKQGQTLTIRHGKYAATTVSLWTEDGALLPRQAYKVSVMPKGMPTDGSAPARTQMGYLVLTSVPDGADVYIDGEFAGTTTLQKKLPIGREVEYRVSKSMYHDATGKIAITSAKTPLNVSLLPAFGSLSVSSTPSGAKVFIDDEEAGVTPFSRDKVLSGDHIVKVQKDMYAPQSRKVTVSDGQRAEISIPLDARFADVKVKTLPGASIKVEGKNIGTGEASTRLMEGMYDVEVSLASHRTVKRQIEVVAGQDQTVELNPTPIYGTLSVESTPIDAEILINGKSYGTTPTIIDNLLIGTYSLTLRKTGCADYTASFTIRENEETTVAGTLDQGRLITISTDGKGDQIYVDDTYIGTSPVTASISFGNHKVYAMRGNDKTQVMSFSVTTSTANNSTVSLNFVYEIAGHEYVDLGLPSGLLWATCNVGARRPEDEGSKFGWGEIKPSNNGNYGEIKTQGKDRSWLKRNSYIDGNDILTMQYDAARSNWGSTWRMPTSEEICELIDNTTTTLTTRNGMKCMVFRSKRNNNSIYLPVNYSSSSDNDYYYGSILSSTFGGGDSSSAYWSFAYSKFDCHLEWMYYYGYESVRPVSGDVKPSTKSKRIEISDLSVTGTIAGHEYVDLGLPSGIKWATCNVGASYPEENGEYFAWGETRTKRSYDYHNCETQAKDINDEESSLRNKGYIDANSNLTLDHDAARANWGSTWHMPTLEEIKELINYTVTTKATLNGVKGRLVTSTINGKSLFLPAAGFRRGTSLNDADEHGHYRISKYREVDELIGYDAINMEFGATSGPFSATMTSACDRSDGISVRAVSK